jgi:Flp pilus assembly pilin Flp
MKSRQRNLVAAPAQSRKESTHRVASRLAAFGRAFWNDEKGQSTTEYILILSVVVLVALKFKNTFGNKLDSIVTNLGNQIDTSISSQQ